MVDRRAKRHLIAISVVGVLAVSVALGIRLIHRKPIHGVWLGYSYQTIDGKLVPDKEFGQYLVKLDKNGTYVENGNATSGTWTQVADTITLKPTKFYDMTPDENRKKFRNKDGKPSVTIERLLAMKMKPMMMTYKPFSDRLIFKEPTLYYEYERSN